ncbi:hypothetical protein JG687_00017715 [Phytophthora cactorum]|uniref:Calmodulin n=1 Tax=Phytophthora cactorum TaxID=29920 RepID=A0A8T1TQP5_9STRA|nr:hypothetical protein JG687_00017715 [Phytophthora cactorum]
MPSADKLLPLQTAYAWPPKSHGLGTTGSAARKRGPGERKSISPALGLLPGKNSNLSPKQWKKWMHDAQELNVSSSLFLATTQATTEGMQLILSPLVAQKAEELALMLEERANDATSFTTTMMKNSPATDETQHWRSRITKPRKRKKRLSLRIEPLLSDEMRTKLHAHLEEKIKGDIWENEIRSRLARPLSASTFCSRNEQLRHPLSAALFVTTTPVENQDTLSQVSNSLATPEVHQPPRTPVVPRFPYSVEAHTSANCIRRCRLKACFRIALKARARILAIAIRVLRRRGIPLLIRGFRRRRRAAIRIQRRYRRFLRWRGEFLRPFVCKNVAVWVHQALTQAASRILIAWAMTTLYQSRKARQAMAARRARHLRRWVAKTRVSLFVHQIWTVCWFHSKRSCNVAGMKQELALFEESDRNVQLEYTVVFATPLGKDVLTRELAVWRVGARTTTTQNESPTTSESDVDPVILRLRQCFRIFDLDGSGTLDLDEFQLMLSYLRGKKQKRPGRGSVIEKRSASESPKLTSAQVRNLFSELDQDGNGSITCTEFESWWTDEHERSTVSTSASTNFLSRGLDSLVLQSHGLLFWLMGRKQQLERKFVKKLVVRRAIEKAKREILHREIHRERAANVLLSVFRCDTCGRRFGLKRDLADHVAYECNSTEWVVDTFTLKRWVHEEEFRLLEGVRE